MIRYSEIFYSIQGEGRWMGTPSVFIRLFSCNFECRGFGQGRDQSKWVSRENMPHKIDPNINNYTSFKELPVPTIGCDSSATWAKEYLHLTNYEEPSVIAKKLLELTPHKTWDNIHLVITGGEPLLWQKQLPELLMQPEFKTLQNLTFETNTTQTLVPNFWTFLENHQAHTTFACSPKLSISGESRTRAIKPNVVNSYSKVKNSELFLKFVVQDEQCLIEVKEVLDDFKLPNDIPVYLMPVGGTQETLNLTEKQVATIALENGLKFSPRLHVNLFGNAWGT